VPIYEYRCNACGHEFERWQKITENPVRTCPRCRKRKVERLLSQTSFQLKGSGWYVTEYGKGSSGATPSAGKDKRAKSNGASDSKDKSKSKKSRSSGSSDTASRST